MMGPLLTASATALARMIRTREVSSRQVVEAHIAHAERVNPILNAIVHDRYADARKEADSADERVAKDSADSLPPFWGVPFTIKECLGVRGLRKTSGLLSRKNYIADEDATAAARLRAAGGIILGVTNVSELMMWYETFNKVYGRTNNPYDPKRIVGGSSGGEGAIIGSGASPAGIGSDVGGSIRMPAFFNGVFGHKPTGGLIPSTGHWPMAENAAARYNTTGPLARRAEDLWPLVKLLAGPDGRDSGCYDIALGDPSSVDLSQLTVLDVEENGAVAVCASLKAAQRRVADHLSARGAKVRSYQNSLLKHSFEIWSAMMDEAADTRFVELLSHGRDAVNPGRELLRWFAGRSPHTLPSLGLALFEPLPKRLKAQAQKALAIGKRLKQELLDEIGPRGVLLYPSFPKPAVKHYRTLLRPFQFAYTGIHNVMEFPATQVPLGLDRGGLPLGVQVVSVPGNDHVTIAVAMELERQFGGWVPPPAFA